MFNMGGPKKPFRVVSTKCPSCGKEFDYVAEGKELKILKLSGEEIFLKLLEKEEKLSSEDFAKRMDISRRQAQRYISPLLKKGEIEGLIEYDGYKKVTYYRRKTN